MIHLPDREYAETIGALQITRDNLRAQGYTGDTCQSALDILMSGCNPSTDGIMFEHKERDANV